MTQTFFLVHDQAKASAHRAIENPAFLGWKVKITPPAKSRDQEEKYHAMIGDIAKECMFMGEKLSAEDWKRLLVDAFVRVVKAEALATGKPDPFRSQGRVLPSLDGSGIVQLGVQTRKFNRGIASEFIEYLYAYGCDQLVDWSEPAMRAYQETRRAA